MNTNPLKDSIIKILKDYRTNKTTLLATELTDLILQEVREVLPKIEDAYTNANKHYTCDYDELDSGQQTEHEGITWGYQDCVKEINTILGPEQKRVKL